MKMIINMYFTNGSEGRNIDNRCFILRIEEGKACESLKGYFTNLFFTCLSAPGSSVKIFYSIAHSRVYVRIISFVRGIVLWRYQVRVGRSRGEMVNGRAAAVLYSFCCGNYQLRRDFQHTRVRDCWLDCY